MSEISGREVVKAMRAVIDTMDSPRLMFKDEIEVLLSYISALEEVANKADLLINYPQDWAGEWNLNAVVEVRAWEGTKQALKNLEEHESR